MQLSAPEIRVLRWLIGLALFPALCLATFYSYVARAAIELGRWPEPYRPDPADLGFELHSGVAFLALIAGGFSPYLMALVAFVPKTLVHEWRVVAIGAISVVLAQIGYRSVLEADPGMFLYWFFD